MSHRVSYIHIIHRPTIAFKLMHNYPMKVLVVHDIVRAKSGSIIVIIDDTVVGMGRIVCAEVCNERRDFALKFYVERFEHIKAVAARLTACQYKAEPSGRGPHQCDSQETSAMKKSCSASVWNIAPAELLR